MPDYSRSLMPARHSSKAGLLLVVWLAPAYLPAFASAQAAPSSLRVEVLDGEGAINNIRTRRARDPVVRVVDDKNAPLPGVSVTFFLPDMGPGGAYPGDVKTLTLLTDEKGQAAGRGLVPNQTAGKYQIRVVASYRGQTTDTVINQINAEPGGAASEGHSKKIWILAAIGGAAAGGLALAVSHKGGSNPAQPTPTPTPGGIVITSGTPIFQPPR